MFATASSPHRLIIAGLPRCGTTLLASLLNQQPGCRFITDYSNWFRDAMQRLHVGWKDPLTVAQRRVCLALAREEWIRFRHPVMVRSFSTIDELHGRICNELVGEAGVIGHKSILNPEDIAHTARDTSIQVIVMVRDPRASALSYWHRTGSDVESYLETWKRTVRICQMRQPNLALLRFEDLIERPLEVLNQITTTWGGVAELPDTLRFNRAGAGETEWEDNSAYHDVKGVVDPQPLGRWRSQINSPIVRYANTTCRKEMLQLGYQPLQLPTREVFQMRLHEWVRSVDRRVEEAFTRSRKALVRKLAPPLDASRN